MTRDQRITLVTTRSGDYFGIMRTTIFAYLAIAAMIEFGSGGYSAPLTTLVIATGAYGILAGGTALDDIIAIRDDMDDEMAGTAYGSAVKGRNIPMLKNISAGILALVALAELYAILV